MTNIPTVQLSEGLTVSAQGYGAMSVAPVYGPVDPAEALATLHHAIDIGVTFIDTANVYGDGASEIAVGTVLKERRDEVQLATKFGLVGNIANGRRSINGKPEYVGQALDESLSRLGVDTVDLYYLHRVDPEVPIEDTVGAIAEQVKAGKVRHIGLSEATGDELRRASRVHPIAAIQSEWSIWSRDVEKHVVPAAAELGIGFVPYSPVGRGFLTGTYDPAVLGDKDLRRRFPRFGDDALPSNLKVLDVVREVAAELDATPAQVSLAWLDAKGREFGLPSVSIPGTRFAARVTENAGAVALTLTEGQIARLDLLADLTVGERTADPTWVSLGRE
ncbi:aldo/keto reductase [Rhodococcus sp. ACS1]|uniref:aldo/keto reductase n=1 Tax=Rhodococcus TaxID=1827 RepID=UPI000BB0DA2B|nr:MULTISPECIES: aldo/keto reductase [Rhodococcus]PBC46743.1 aldo/keto reductase [Rhodococcus sp. ACS1]QSE82727.1 aldo/keto reductase [Rhodococcus koreensis]QYB02493.1 aldo/keto reductase [Rhodococcus sp. USK10]